jgi:hypothetical protein
MLAAGDGEDDAEAQSGWRRAREGERGGRLGLEISRLPQGSRKQLICFYLIQTKSLHEYL